MNVPCSLILQDHSSLLFALALIHFACQTPKVATGGTVVGEAMHPQLVPEKTQMVAAIMRSCWPAVTEADPTDDDSKPFLADAVISNPPAIGHIHVCEALSIPLHIMFPQPWFYPTKSFPHPM